jgi:hypothetical protein
MDQIHLSPLVDQIQLALGHISNNYHGGVGFVLAPRCLSLHEHLGELSASAWCDARRPFMVHMWCVSSYRRAHDGRPGRSLPRERLFNVPRRVVCSCEMCVLHGGSTRLGVGTVSPRRNPVARFWQHAGDDR